MSPMNITIIARCLSQQKTDDKGNYLYHFHFQGHFRGEKIKRVILQSPIPFLLQEDYVLYVIFEGIKQGTLEVSLQKYIPIKELCLQYI